MTKQAKKKHDQGFKDEAVRLGLSGEKPIIQTARDLGINQHELYYWIEKAKGSKEPVQDGDKTLSASELIEELNRLRKENSRLKEEREILKKATAFFAKEGQKP